MALNLHRIVRSSINAVNADTDVQVLRSLGSLPDDEGRPVPRFERLTGVRAQVQSEKDASLFHADMVGANTITRRIYLYAPDDPAKAVGSGFRPLSKSGDYIVMRDGTVWMVNAVVENFSASGWVSVRAQLQVRPPEGIEWL